MKKWNIHLLVLIVIGIIASTISFVFGLKCSSNEIIEAKKLSAKYLELFKIAIKWIKNQEKIESFIDSNKNKTIGIYGMSYLGDCLQLIFRKKGLTHIYGIDRNACRLYNSDLTIYDMKSKLPYMDIIIVTAIMDFEQIKQELKRRIKKNIEIISLEDIFYLW